MICLRKSRSCCSDLTILRYGANPGTCDPTGVLRWKLLVGVCLVAGLVSYGASSARSMSLSAAGRPPTGDLAQEYQYIRAASRQALAMPACRRRAIPAVSHGVPSQALLSLLGVLRRPMNADDRLPHRLAQNDSARGVYVDYIRLARIERGVSYYVVPARLASPPAALPSGCFAVMSRALHNELPRIPPRLRKPTKTLFAQQLARERKPSAEAAEDGICLLFAGPVSSGGACGASAKEIKRNGLLSSFGWFSGVVPDGVASVTVRYSASGGIGLRTATSNVVGNVFVVPIKRPRPATPWPAMVWRSADGSIVKTLPATRRADLVAGRSGFCSSQTPSGCL